MKSRNAFSWQGNFRDSSKRTVQFKIAALICRDLKTIVRILVFLLIASSYKENSQCQILKKKTASRNFFKRVANFEKLCESLLANHTRE